MKPLEIAKGIYSVGVIDWNIRDFHGYSTYQGSTYNAYLIIDEKITLIDTVKKEFADTLRLADHIFIEELRNHDLYDKVSQAFVVFLPVKSVGVTGDGRRYNHVVSLRAVENARHCNPHRWTGSAP